VALAESLGAVPLLRVANALAKRARLALTDTALPAPPADPFGLTPRERDVLRLLSAGESNRRIAEHLYISEKTVGVHVSHILTKLGVSNRGEAAAMTHRLGLFD
jgi:DNA-binding NarL/FixJ family response regulator